MRNYYDCEIFECISFWNQIIKCVGARRSAIIVLAGENKEADQLMVRFLPFLQKEIGAGYIVLVAETEDVLMSAQNESRVFVETMLCSRSMIDGICRIQAIDSYYHDLLIFVDRFIGREDADGYQLIGSYGLSLRDIVARVFLRLHRTPTREEEKTWLRIKKKPCLNRIKWEEFISWIPEGGNTYSSIELRVHNRLKEIQKKGGILSSSKIVIHGDTKTAQACLRENIADQVIGITDNNENKWGERRGAVSILNPADIYADYDSELRILISNSRFREICTDLYYKGYQLGKQVFLLNDPPELPNLIDENRIQSLERKIIEDRQVYELFREKYPTQTILLSPWSASGDIYICAMYLTEYIGKMDLEDYILVVTTSAAERVAHMCGFDTVRIAEDEALHLMGYARWNGFEESGIKNINIFVKGNHRINTFEPDIDWNTFHQRLVFQSDIRKTKADFRQEDAGHFFDEYDLEIGRTVLIAPYSQSMGRIPEEICLRLVSLLKGAGYSVVTNISGDEEPLDDTVGLQIPYIELIDFVNKAGTVISMRSGLCDIVSSTDSKMVVFFPEGNKVWPRYFSLHRMGLKTNGIMELLLDEETVASSIGKIGRFLCCQAVMPVKHYTENDIEEAEDRLRRGGAYVESLRRDHGKSEEDWVVFLFSEDERINRCTLYYLPLLLRKTGREDAVIVSPYETAERIAEEYLKCSYQFISCNEENMWDVCRYYSMFREYEPDYVRSRVIINGSPYHEDNRLLNIIGYNNIDIKEYVAFAVYRFNDMPEDAEAEHPELIDREYRKLPDLAVIPKDYYPEAMIREFEGGRCIYDSIRQKYPDARIYLVPYPGTGDMVITGMYLWDRMQKDGVTSGVLVVSAKSCEYIFSLLNSEANISGVVVLDGRKDAVKLLRFAKQVGYEKTNVFMINDAFDLIDIGKLRGYKGLDFNTLFQKAVFSTKPIRHEIGLITENADDIFNLNGIRKGRTVLLSPYTKSMSTLSMDFWERLARDLTSKGYDVITNTSSDELPVRGTRGLMIPYSKLIDFLNKAGTFIGIRSGLCDVAAGSAAKKVILYKTHFEANTSSSIGFFGLRSMGIGREPLYEMVLDDESEKIITEIMDVVDN